MVMDDKYPLSVHTFRTSASAIVKKSCSSTKICDTISFLPLYNIYTSINRLALYLYVRRCIKIDVYIIRSVDCWLNFTFFNIIWNTGKKWREDLNTNFRKNWINLFVRIFLQWYTRLKFPVTTQHNTTVTV